MIIKLAMKKIECVECGISFTGRSDKKFCSDQCRSSFNNKLNSDANNVVRNINNILRKNRRILADLLKSEKERVTKDRLSQVGFNFKYCTHQFTSKKGNFYQFWYDHGLMTMDKGYFFIVKSEAE